MLRDWASRRVQWGRASVSTTRRAMLGYGRRHVRDGVARRADRGEADTHRFDIRLEAAIAKLWPRGGWSLVNDAVQGAEGGGTRPTTRSRICETATRDVGAGNADQHDLRGSSEISACSSRGAVRSAPARRRRSGKPEARGAKLRALVRAACTTAGGLSHRFLGWGFWPRTLVRSAAPHVRFIMRASRGCSRDLPRDGALRARAREASGGARQTRRHRRGLLVMRPWCHAHGCSSRGEDASDAPSGRPALPPRSSAHRGALPRAVRQRRKATHLVSSASSKGTGMLGVGSSRWTSTAPSAAPSEKRVLAREPGAG